MLKAEVAVDVQEVFQQVFLIIFFFVDRHVFSSILAWQVKHGKKTFKWTVHYQEECLWSIFTSSIYCFQYRPKCRLPYLVVGCRSCPCNLLRANKNNTQLKYRVRIIWNGVNINTVLQNLVKLDRIEKANCIFEWDPANLLPGQSILIASTSQIKIHKQKESYLLF